jgi:hypothetical protein
MDKLYHKYPIFSGFSLLSKMKMIEGLKLKVNSALRTGRTGWVEYGWATYLGGGIEEVKSLKD